MHRWTKRGPWICIYCGPYEPQRFMSRAEIDAVMRGLADVDAGRAKPLEQIRRELRERSNGPS